MRWARSGAIALLSLFILAGVAPAQVVIDSPGRYEATVVAVPDFTPPGLPPLGPSAFHGELLVVEVGRGWKVMFMGESDSGDKLVANGAFSSGWAGIRLGPFMVGSVMIPDAVIGIDVAHLERGHVNGVGLVGGVIRRLNAQVGPGGVVEHMQIH